MADPNRSSTGSYIKKIEKVQMRAFKQITCIKTSRMQKDLVTLTYQQQQQQQR